MNKVFCTIATGSPFYYHAAHTLAMSLKYHGSKIPFILFCDGGNNLAHIRKEHRGVWDKIVYLSNNDKTPFYSKTRIYELMPKEVKEFIFIDADSLCLKNPDDLFNDMPDFGPMTEKKGTYGNHRIDMSWAKPESIYDYYGCPHSNVFTEINSSIMRVKRGNVARDIFKLAEHFYAADFYDPAERLGGHYPDELAFETAMLSIGYVPPDFRPLYIHYAADRQTPMSRLSTWRGYFLSLPGPKNHVARYTWDEYKKHRVAWNRKLYGIDGYPFVEKMKAANQKVKYSGLRPNSGPKWVDRLVKKYETKPEELRIKKDEEE